MGSSRYHLHPDGAGFVYVFAVLDWASRRVLAWRLSNTLTTDFCLDAVQGAVGRYDPPEIFNTDQGCQFTTLEFTGLLAHHGMQITIDEKGCWQDNVFVERLLKSITHEEVYLHAYETVSAGHQGVERHLTFCNQTDRTGRLTARRQTRCIYDNLPARLTAA